MRPSRSNVVKKPMTAASDTSHPPNTPPVPIRDIELDLIDPSTTQPRRHFEDNALNELAASIRLQGVLQPIIVRPRGARFEVIAGERRVRASRLAGLTTIPAQVRDIDDAAARQVQIIENLQRENIHPLEEADACQALLDSDKAIQAGVIVLGENRAPSFRSVSPRRSATSTGRSGRPRQRRTLSSGRRNRRPRKSGSVRTNARKKNEISSARPCALPS